MADETFRFRLDSEDGEFLRSLARSQQAIGRFANNADARLRRLSTGFDTLRRAALGFVSVYSGIRLVRGVSDASTGLQRIQSALVVATGSTEAARREFEFISAEADRLGLSLATTAQEYAAVAAASRGTAIEGETTREIFLGVTEAATALGLTAEQTGGALTAIQQIISKGRVSAEELRQQLGERLPGAFQIAARSIGVTTAELDDLLQRGALTADQLLPELARELRETFGAQATEQAQNLAAQLNRLETASFNFLNAVGRGGLAEAIGDLAESLTEAADGSDGLAEAIGATLGEALRFAGEAALFLAQNIEVISAAVAALIASRLVVYVVELVTALRAAAVATAAFSAALVATPIGAFALAVTAVGSAVALMVGAFDDAEGAIDNADAASRRMSRTLDDIGDAAGTAAGQVDQLTQATFELRQQQARLEFNQIQTEISLLGETINNALRLQAAAQLEAGASMDVLFGELEELVAQFQTYGRTLTMGLIPLTAFESGLDSLGRRFEGLTGTVDNGRARLQAFVNLFNQIYALDVRGAELGDILAEPPPGGGGPITTPTPSSAGRSSGSRRDRFPDELADLQAQIDAERRLQEAYRESDAAVERAEQRTRLLAEIRRIEAQFTGEQRDQLVALTEELYRQAEVTREVEETTSTRREAQELVNEILTEGANLEAAYAAAVDVLNGLLREGKINADQYADGLERLNEEFSQGEGLGQDVGSAVSGAFREIVTDIDNAEAAAARFLERLAEIVLQAAILGPIENALSGGIGNLFGSGGKPTLIKGKASGGPVSPFTPYLVGERGQELFVPQVPGTIIPNHEMRAGGGGAGASVNVSIAIDATGADAAGLARVEREVAALQQTLPGQITAVIASQVRSGGPMAKTVGRRR